jgi:hypothetical protein
MPTANAEGQIESEGSIGKISVRRVFRHLRIGAGPRRSPSACSEILRKKTRARPEYLGALQSDWHQDRPPGGAGREPSLRTHVGVRLVSGWPRLLPPVLWREDEPYVFMKQTVAIAI